MPPSDVTPTIHEVDEEEAESEPEVQGQDATPTEPSEQQMQVIRLVTCLMSAGRFTYYHVNRIFHLDIPNIGLIQNPEFSG